MNVFFVYFCLCLYIQSQNAEQFVYLGVMKSPIGRIQNKFRLQILMRLKPECEEQITNKLFELADIVKKPDVSIFVEINPQNLS